MCCPSGYSNQRATSGPVNGNCVSDISNGMVLTYASTAQTASTDWVTATTTMSASSSVGAIAVVGYNVARTPSSSTSPSALRPTTSPSTSLSPSSSMASTSSSAASSAPTSSTGVRSGTEGGMSTGIKVGIGLGVTLGVIGIVALVFAMIILRRRREKGSHGSDTAVPVLTSESGSRDKSISAFHQDPREYQHPVDELYTHSQPSELPPGEARSPVEMESQGR
ncbi:hypothetical protein CC80DRAFT_539202 [Byssothecium circinans]|uniref:Mid2 domain-containing protein n=1 Tax=Byssothecium circinans TaxID=147558 RepID=A0A6A5TQ45_9PLEO|nr:hypothetical protein CC80DRAFT_539202 [Byssothecium circinans]